jgi:asparagine synthase (glutamine-hydrolysing)
MDAAELYANSLLVFDAPSRRALLDFGPVGEPERLLTDAWRSLPADAGLDHMMGVDVATYLPGDLLAKMDTATMAHSVEARSPLLDHELMEFAAALPAELKRGKGLLRSALRGVLPDEIIERPKMGFAVPLAAWLRGELAGRARELLLDPGSAIAGYVRRGEVERLMREHTAGVDHSMRLWALMMLETWHREVLAAPGG